MTTARHSPDAGLAARSFLRPGHNCWRVERATRARLVQDAAEYFALARAAILRAQHSVFVLGWDLLANLDLVPGAADDGAPRELAALLAFAARRRPGLQVHVLVWDHSTLYSLERDPFTRFRFGWLRARRVHFRFDDHHPLGGSHHDKVLVVDDTIAFAGSIDLTTHRWDTTAHEVDNPLRVNARGQAYPPYHDVQLLVEGPAARALGEHARARWLRLGRHKLPPVANTSRLDWPPPAPHDLHDVDVAIARTIAPFRGRPGVRECETLFADTVAAAREWIYVENQYFTDASLAHALAARLREPDGPEILVVGPRQCEGWLEKKTMGVLRAKVLAELRAADEHDRLRVLHPMASRTRDVATFVHSKVMIVDGELLRVGSANLARRSMGMDSECDLAVVAGGDGARRAGIEHFCHRLLAEHLGVSPADVQATWARERSLLRTVDALAGGDRTLVPVACDPTPAEPGALQALADPDEPMDIVTSLASALPELEAETDRARRVARVLPALVLGIAVLASWRVRDLVTQRSLDEVTAMLTTAPHSPWVVAGTALALAVAGLSFLPLQLLTLVAATLIGPLYGGTAAVLGSTVAAATGYRIGAAITPRRLASWIGARAYRLLRLLHRPETLAIATLRFVPVVSSTTLHLLCGVARAPVRAYALGTLIGLLPAILSACLVGALARRALLRQEPWTGVVAAAVAALLVSAMLRLRRMLLQQHARRAQAGQGERARFG